MPIPTATQQLLEHITPGAHAATAATSGPLTHNAPDNATELEMAAKGSILAPLTDQCVLRVQGEDAVSFLQGQLTADVSNVSNTRSLLSAWLTPKGRVITLMRLFHHAGALHLQLPRSMAEVALKRLRMYVLRARAEFVSIDDHLALLGVSGKVAAARLAADALSPGAEAGSALQSAECTVIRLHGEPPRFQLVGTATSLAAIARRLADVAQPVGLHAWRSLEVRAGVPAIDPSTTDAYLPQMLNLQALGGVSFDKGCYVGQEIVARTQYLGRLKRRLYVASTDGSADVSTGMTIRVGDSGRNAGSILNVAQLPGDRTACLAVIQIDAADGPLRLDAPQDAELRIEPLPYELPAS